MPVVPVLRRQTWWSMPVNPALRRQRKQDNKFETSLYIVKLCLKTTKVEGAAAKEERIKQNVV